MSAEENKAVIRRFVEGLSTQSFDTIATVLGPEYTNYMPGAPGPLKGDTVKPVFDEFFTAFPDMQVDVHEMVAEGDTVATRYTIHATHRGPFQGLPPTGKRITVAGASFYHVKNGKIVDDYPGFDALSLMQQLGAIPSPEPART